MKAWHDCRGDIQFFSSSSATRSSANPLQNWEAPPSNPLNRSFNQSSASQLFSYYYSGRDEHWCDGGCCKNNINPQFIYGGGNWEEAGGVTEADVDTYLLIPSCALTHSMVEHFYGLPPREETGETFSNYKEHTN